MPMPSNSQQDDYWSCFGCEEENLQRFQSSNSFGALESDNDDYEKEYPEVKEPAPTRENIPENKVKRMPKRMPQKVRKKTVRFEKVEQDIDKILKEMEDEYEKTEHNGERDDEPGAFCFVEEEFADGDEVYDVHGSQSEYTKASCVMDSGSADHVTSREMAPNIEVKASEGSRRGQHYVTANGGRIPNEGQQRLEVATEEGMPAAMDWQITDVRRPLCSVSKLTDRGNRVIFG